MSQYPNQKRTEELFKALVGRTVSDFTVELRPEKLSVRFTDGVVLALWVDEDACLCLDVDREARH